MKLYKKATVRIISLLLALTMIFAQFPALNLAVTANAVEDPTNKYVVYVNGSSSAANSSGTAQEPYKTLTEAYTALYNAGRAQYPVTNNIIVISGPTTMNHSAELTLDAVPATITSVYGGTDYRTSNSAKLDATGATAHIHFSANTTLENIKFDSAGAIWVTAYGSRLVMAHEGSVPTVVGSDLMIHSGSYTNVFAGTNTSTGMPVSIQVTGGSIGTVGAVNNAHISTYDMVVTGGTIANIQPGAKSGGAYVNTLNVTIAGEPTISGAIKGKQGLHNTDIVTSIDYSGYTGDKTALAAKISNFDTVISEAAPTVVYVNGTVEESGNGRTAETAVKTLQEAYALLDAANGMDVNTIVICGNTTIEFTNSKDVEFPAVPVTITGNYGGTDYGTALTGSSTNAKNIYFTADTTIEDLKFSFSTSSQVRNYTSKLIMDVDSSVQSPTVAGIDLEIRNGDYINVFADGGTADYTNVTLRVSGGTIGTLGSANQAKIGTLNMYVSGGTITNLYSGNKGTGKTFIKSVNVYISGEPAITTIAGKQGLEADPVTVTKIDYTEYTGNKTVLAGKITGFDKVVSDAAPTVIYVNGTVTESGDGKTAETAVKTLQEAYALLDPENGMDVNTIVICGDTTVTATEAIPAVPATITGSFDSKDYGKTLTAESHIEFTADTAIENLKFGFASSYQVRNYKGRLILNLDPSVQTPTVAGIDLEIRNGNYINVFADGNTNDDVRIKVTGGSIGTLGVAGGETLTSVTYTVTGGNISNLYGGPKSGSAFVRSILLNVEGEPTFGKMDGKKSLSNAATAQAVMDHDAYTGDRAALEEKAVNFVTAAQLAAKVVIYVDGTAGSDENDGLTPGTAVKTVQKAYEKLDSTKGMDKNIIVICGDTTIEFTEGTDVTFLAVAATITGVYGGVTYGKTLTGSSTNPKNIVFTADTTIENLKFGFSTSSWIRNETSKLILDLDPGVKSPTVAGVDLEIRNGNYINVFADGARNANISITVSGGSITALCVAQSEILNKLTVTVTGGSITNFYGGAKSGNAYLNNVSLTLSGNPTVTNLDGKFGNSNAGAATAYLYYDSFTGDAVALLNRATNFDNVKAQAPVTVYVNGGVETSGDGSTPEKAFKTLQEAYRVLDIRNSAEENVIVICGDTVVDLSETVTLPARKATITGQYGGVDYSPVLSGSESGKNLVFQADVLIQELELSMANTTQIQSTAGKMILNQNGTAPTVAASDVEIYDGSYINVYVRPDADGNGTVKVDGGTITNLAVEMNQKINTLTYLISGGNITNVWGGPRFGDRNITAVDITLSGAPNITSIVGEYLPAGATDRNGGTSWLNFCGYTGSVSFAASKYDNLGVVAAQAEEKASFEDLEAAYQLCKTGGTITLRSNVDVTGTSFPVEPTGIVIIRAENNEILNFTQGYFVFRGKNQFHNIALKFSADESNPTVLYYQDEAPVIAETATIDTVNKHYKIQKLEPNGNGVTINFGDKLTEQETNGYPAITAGTDSKEASLDRFNQTVDALPGEVPQIDLFSTNSDDYEIHIYVATDGDDSTGNGSIEQPFATVQRALEAVEEIPVLERNGGVAIYIRGGTYNLTSTLNITASHSPLPAMGKLLIAAYPGEKVSLAGGVGLKGSNFQLATENNVDAESWAKLSDDVKGKVYVVDLEAMGITDYFQLKESKDGGVPVLTMNNQQMTLARYPDVGEVTFKDKLNDGFGGGSSYIMDDLRPLSWDNTGRIYVRGSFYAEWWKTVGRIAEIDEVTKSITTHGYIGWGDASLDGGIRPLATNTHYYYNILEELTIPGEWFLDEDTGLLYVYPASGSMADGDELCLTTTDEQFLVNISNANDVIISGITVENGNGGVNVTGSSNVIMQQCTVQDMGGYGVKIFDSYKCGMIYSTLRRTDYVAFETQASVESTAALKPTRCFLQNCLIYDIKVTSGQIYGVGDIFTHNTVHYTRSMGISVHAQESIFEYNEMIATSYAQSDAGAFYVPGSAKNQGNVFRYNYIHDSNPPGTSNARGIYMDDICSTNYTYGNIVENMALGLFVHSGDENVYVNNVLINCTESATISDACSVHTTWATRWGYYGDIVTWDNSLDPACKAIWDARYPSYAVKVNQVKEAVALWNSGDKEADIVSFVRAATYNVIKDNLIINGGDVLVYEYAAPYTLIAGNQRIIDVTDEEIKETYTLGSDVYKKVGITDPSKLGEAATLHDNLYLLAPADTSFTAETVDFKWTKVNGASYYVLTVARDEDFTVNVQTFKTTEAEKSVPLSGPIDADYYWKVEAICLAKYDYEKSVTSPVGHFNFTKEGSLMPTDVLNYRPIIDGTMDAAYEASGYIAVQGDTQAMSYLAWDKEYLYAYVEVYKLGGVYSNPALDTYLKNGDLDSYYANFNTEDGITVTVGDYAVSVHADGDGYYGYYCTMDGWNSDAPYAVRAMDGGSGYVVEMKIPVEKALEAGDQFDLGLQLHVADGQGNVQTIRDASTAKTYTLNEKTWADNAEFLHGSAVIDAEMDPAYYYTKRLELGPMTNATLGDRDDTELSGYLYTLWERDYVYYYAIVNTDSITSNPKMDEWLKDYQENGNEDSLALWKTFRRFEDCLELVTHTQYDNRTTTTTVHADGNGYINSYQNDTNGEYATRITYDEEGKINGYVIEVKVPLYDIAIEGHVLGVEFNADSIDTTGLSTADTSMTKWEYYQKLVNDNAGSNYCEIGGVQKGIISQTPLYQYKQSAVFATLSGETMKQASYRVDFAVNAEGAAIVVKQNGTVVDPQADGTYVLEEGSYTYSITADGYCPASGEFTVSGMKHIDVELTAHQFVDGTCEKCDYVCAHTGGEATCKTLAVCTACGESYGVVDADKHGGVQKWTQTATTHSKAYDCCNEPVVAEESHEWVDGVCSECGYGCSHTGGTATCGKKAICTKCGKEYGELAAHKPEADDGDCTTDIKCAVCGEVTTKGADAHTGGTATCKDKAKCEACGKEYGELAAHTLTHVPAKAATATADGNLEHWACTCGKLFSDKDGKTETTLEKVTVKYVAPEDENPTTRDTGIVLALATALIPLGATVILLKKKENESL